MVRRRIIRSKGHVYTNRQGTAIVLVRESAAKSRTDELYGWSLIYGWSLLRITSVRPVSLSHYLTIVQIRMQSRYGSIKRVYVTFLLTFYKSRHRSIQRCHCHNSLRLVV